MTTMDTRYATTQPIISIANSALVNDSPNLIIFRALSPNITGTARKNVNSAAATLDTPMSRAPMMVAPERDVHGEV